MPCKCWVYPEGGVKQKVKVWNKKYCWLYPEEKKKLLNKMIPNFDHCKTLYTICDFILEHKTNNQLLKVEELLKDFHHNLVSEQQMQLQILDRMWVLSQRYLILTEAGKCIKLYPEIVSAPLESDILDEYKARRRVVDISNCHLSAMLDVIKEEIEELDICYGKLDLTLESPFLIGNETNWYERPFLCIREKIDDLFKLFTQIVCKQHRWLQLIYLQCSASMEDYIALLKASGKPKAILITDLEDCKCLRTNKKDCIPTTKDCIISKA